jgi:hypothetical protein
MFSIILFVFKFFGVRLQPFVEIEEELADLNYPEDIADHYPTLPSSDMLNNFCASMANSIGRLFNTSLQYPFTIIFTASSAVRPRWLQ